MAVKTFRAMVVHKADDSIFERRISERSVEELPGGEVLVRVRYSSLNYKDALSASGHKGVTRQYPHTPGIDASGIVEESTHDDFYPGEEVIVTGYDLGMNTSGGFGEFIRVPAAWVVKRPGSLSLREAMIYGTAGFTAAQSVFRLTAYGITPEHGEVLVTGASGGVGSHSVAILSRCGFHVVAASGKAKEKDFLLTLGAKEVISRDAVTDTSVRPLLKARWAAAIDTVGGPILETIIKSTKHRGAIACCGNVASADLRITIFPFILRGVSLFGIDSANCPMPDRLRVWEKLASEWKAANLDSLATEISLDALDHHIALILQGKLKGRVIVNLEK